MNRNYLRAIPREWQAMSKAFTAMGDEHRQRILLTFEKGDRLNVVFSRAPDAHASGRVVLRHLMEQTRSRALREACEPPASPYVDPQLAKLPGRCLS